MIRRALRRLLGDSPLGEFFWPVDATNCPGGASCTCHERRSPGA